jgi:MFS family permease
MRHIPIAGAAHGIGMFGAALWLPSYFMRTHHMTATGIGVRLALIMGAAGMIGTLSGGLVADRLAAKTGDARWYTWTCGLAVLCAVPLSIGVYLSPSPTLALLLFIGPAILNHMFLGPVVATMQNLGGVRHRAVAAALYLFLVNLISMGLGPLLVGVLSDSLQSVLGADALRYSLMTLTTLTSTWAAVQMYLASRTLRADLALAK